MDFGTILRKETAQQDTEQDSQKFDFQWELGYIFSTHCIATGPSQPRLSHGNGEPRHKPHNYRRTNAGRRHALLWEYSHPQSDDIRASCGVLGEGTSQRHS